MGPRSRRAAAFSGACHHNRLEWIPTSRVSPPELLAVRPRCSGIALLRSVESFQAVLLDPGQLASLLLRIGFGYLLFVVSILFLEFITASGKPLDTQPITVV